MLFIVFWTIDRPRRHVPSSTTLTPGIFFTAAAPMCMGLVVAVVVLRADVCKPTIKSPDDPDEPEVPLLLQPLIPEIATDSPRSAHNRPRELRSMHAPFHEIRT